ncbi:hypothetical protein [Streptomyces sp. NPDC059743]|uniref:hypothetical protein n=1 Tax=Streptomyces sp. NPDC059743 TaxID=3346928 RepID=UPI0036567BD9
MHWHGYRWSGARQDMRHENVRRPDHRDFLESRLPPMMTGWWLLRSRQTSTARTWTRHAAAVEWIRTAYDEQPPSPGTGPSPDTKTAYAADTLPRGVDVVWGHYTEGGTFVSLSVVCCPNRHWPGIACPLGMER